MVSITQAQQRIIGYQERHPVTPTTTTPAVPTPVLLTPFQQILAARAMPPPAPVPTTPTPPPSYIPVTQAQLAQRRGITPAPAPITTPKLQITPPPPIPSLWTPKPISPIAKLIEAKQIRPTPSAEEAKLSSDIIKTYGLQTSYEKAIQERSQVPPGFVSPVKPGPAETAFNAEFQQAYQQYTKDIAWEGWQKLPAIVKQNIKASSKGIPAIGDIPILSTVYEAVTTGLAGKKTSEQRERQMFESYYLPTAQKLQYISRAPPLEKLQFAALETLPGLFYTGVVLKPLMAVKAIGAGAAVAGVGLTGYGAYQSVQPGGEGLAKFALTTGVSFATMGLGLKYGLKIGMPKTFITKGTLTTEFIGKGAPKRTLTTITETTRLKPKGALTIIEQAKGIKTVTEPTTGISITRPSIFTITEPKLPTEISFFTKAKIPFQPLKGGGGFVPGRAIPSQELTMPRTPEQAALYQIQRLTQRYGLEHRPVEGYTEYLKGKAIAKPPVELSELGLIKKPVFKISETPFRRTPFKITAEPTAIEVPSKATTVTLLERAKLERPKLAELFEYKHELVTTPRALTKTEVRILSEPYQPYTQFRAPTITRFGFPLLGTKAKITPISAKPQVPITIQPQFPLTMTKVTPITVQPQIQQPGLGFKTTPVSATIQSNIQKQIDIQKQAQLQLQQQFQEQIQGQQFITPPRPEVQKQLEEDRFYEPWRFRPEPPTKAPPFIYAPPRGKEEERRPFYRPPAVPRYEARRHREFLISPFEFEPQERRPPAKPIFSRTKSPYVSPGFTTFAKPLTHGIKTGSFKPKMVTF